VPWRDRFLLTANLPGRPSREAGVAVPFTALVGSGTRPGRWSHDSGTARRHGGDRCRVWGTWWQVGSQPPARWVSGSRMASLSSWPTPRARGSCRIVRAK